MQHPSQRHRVARETFLLSFFVDLSCCFEDFRLEVEGAVEFADHCLLVALAGMTDRRDKRQAYILVPSTSGSSRVFGDLAGKDTAC